MFSIGLAGNGRLAAVFIAAALTVGCTSRGGNIPYGEGAMTLPDPAGAIVPAQNNNLAPGDKLKITVFQVEELTGEYTVDAAGQLAFPLAGSVDVVGKTPEELGRELERLLAVDYLQQPRVSVGVVETDGRTVTVDGAVRQPGVFPVRTRLTLIDAIALARGTDEFSNPRRVAIFRLIDGQRMAAAFDLTSIRQGEMENPRVYPGDIVVVEEQSNRRLLNQVFGALPILALFRPY